MQRALGAAVVLLALTGCQNLPPPYSPPEQFTPFETFRPYRISRTISMFDDGASVHFLSGILPPANGWSWTNQRPMVKVKTHGTQNVHYLIDFSVPDVTFKETGPVTIRFLVNDHVLDSVRYDKPGPQHFEKDVPAEWLKPDSEERVGAEIDKVWVSKTDGARLGFILTVLD